MIPSGVLCGVLSGAWSNNQNLASNRMADSTFTRSLSQLHGGKRQFGDCVLPKLGRSRSQSRAFFFAPRKRGLLPRVDLSSAACHRCRPFEVPHAANAAGGARVGRSERAKGDLVRTQNRLAEIGFLVVVAIETWVGFWLFNKKHFQMWPAP